MKRIIAVLVLSGVVVLTSLVGTPTTSSATPRPTPVSAEVGPVPARGQAPAIPVDSIMAHTLWTTWIHDCPTLACNHVSDATPSDNLVDLCWIPGEFYHGFNAWDLILDTSTNVAGFVNESDLNTQDQSVRCYG